VIDDVLKSLDRVRKGSDGWFSAKCPAHDDDRPSLGVKAGDNGGVIVKCHTGCSFDEIVRALESRGVDRASLFPEKQNDRPKKNSRRIVATYRYADEEDLLIFEKVRYEPKEFSQRRPDGNGGWIWNLDGCRRVLYGLPAVLAARSVLVVESEKTADRLNEDLAERGDGICATCAPGGAGDWCEEFSATLAGKIVYILVDNDDQVAVTGASLRAVTMASRWNRALSSFLIYLTMATHMTGSKRATP
jgi:putative DNA primase/helicase